MQCKSKADALLIERWLKAGNTTKKRKVVIRALECTDYTFYYANIIGAARKWQERKSYVETPIERELSKE